MTICKLGKYMKYFVVNKIEIQAKPKYYCYFRENKNKLFWNKNFTLYLTGTVSLKFAYDRDLEPKRLRNTDLCNFQVLTHYVTIFFLLNYSFTLGSR